MRDLEAAELDGVRLVIVNHVARMGGAERVLMNTLKHLDREKCRAEVVFLQDGPLVRETEELGYPVHVCRSGRLRNPAHFAKTVAAIRTVVRGSRAQLVVGWAPKPHMYGGLAAWLEGVPAVWWQHGVPGGSLFDRIVARVPARSVLCPSEAVSEAQRKFSGASSVQVQYPGILDEEFRLDPEVRAEVRRQYGIADSATVFAFVGRLQRWKRADVVIRAFREALAGKDARLLIVGGALFGVDTGVEDELKALVRESGLADQVIFTGHQSRVGPCLWASDAVVHSSLFEPFGMVIVEAMASGRIVLAVNKGGPAEIIRHGRNGLLYDGSEAQLAELMRRVWRSGAGFEGMRQAAVRTVHDRFTAAVMAEGFQRHVASVVT